MKGSNRRSDSIVKEKVESGDQRRSHNTAPCSNVTTYLVPDPAPGIQEEVGLFIVLLHLCRHVYFMCMYAGSCIWTTVHIRRSEHKL